MMRDARMNDALFESIFEAAAIGVAVGDVDGRLLRCNGAFQTLFGYSEAELQTMTFRDLTHPADADAHSERFAELMAGDRTSFRLLKRYIHRDGGSIRAEVTVSRVPGGLVLGVVKDVTAEWTARDERERLVHRLGERVKELTALHEAARVIEPSDLSTPMLVEGIAALLPPAFQHTAVAAARVSYGQTVSETVGYRPTPWQLVETFSTSDGTTGSLDVVYLDERPIEAEGAFLAEERALLATLAEMVRSRIDRRIAEDEVRHTQERLRMALASVDMGFWEWDIPADRMVWSPDMARLFGMGSAPLVGRFGERFHLIHPDDLAAVRTAFRQTLADVTASTAEMEVRITPPGQDLRWVYAKAHIFRDADGHPLRMLGVMLDITRRRLLQEQFLQAQKMEAVGQFAGGIAHDFNNALAVIIGQCDLMGTGALASGEQQVALADISDAAGRAARLTDQLLTFSRKGKTSPQVLDANKAVSRMESFVRRLAGPSELRLELGADTGCVRLDPGQLEQAIMNLVVNARDAMTTPGVITIRTNTTSDGQVAIAVTDTGTGMDDATRARIFEPFFTTKEPGKGTGLGLAVVLGVVQAAQGEVRVETAPGQGTTFELRFPRVVTDLPDRP